MKRIPPVAIREKPLETSSLFSKLQICLLVVLLVPLSLFISAFLFRQSYFSVPSYQPGDIARADIITPMDAFIEDKAATQALREEAKKKALPVFRFNASLADSQVSRLNETFVEARNLLRLNAAGTDSRGSRKRSFRGLSASEKSQIRSALQNLGIKPPLDNLLNFLTREGFNATVEDQIAFYLKDALSTMVVSDDTLFTKDAVHKLHTATGKEETVSVSLISTLTQTQKKIDRRISQDSGLAAASRPYIIHIVEDLIAPNMVFDETLTELRRKDDMKNVDHVLRKLKKGKVVLRQGDEVTADHLIQIEAIRGLSTSGFSMKPIIGMGFLIGILLTAFIFFVRFIPSGQWSYLKLVGFLVLILTVNLILLKASWFVCESVSQSFLAMPFNDKSYFFYLLPFAFGSMLVTLLAGERCAQVFVIFFCILAAQSIGTDFYGFFYILVTNLAGIIYTRRATQRIGIIGAGFKLGLSAAIIFLVLQIARQAPLEWMSSGFGVILAFLSGLFNATFLVFMLPLCERLFMVTTEIRLSELGNLNLALIRELILKAPGTYNHSIAVGTLCEGAAKAIGLNPLFLRIASLYHDIGKTVLPEYFVENQQQGNPHERIDCRQSLHILKSHVTYGMAIAKKANLPSAIIDLIPQHHGTKLMKFFYERAKASSSEEDVHEDQFRYPGPKPQTKEAAIMMLADGIEAAARTLKDHSQNRLLDLIRKIIADTTEDGQFSECDITLSEINLVTYSFLETLSSYYHGRIAYPGFDFN